MNKMKIIKKDDVYYDYYKNFIGQKCAYSQKLNNDKFTSFIKIFKSKGIDNIIFVKKDKQQNEINKLDVIDGVIEDMIKKNKEVEENKLNESSDDYCIFELYNLHKDRYKDEKLKINDQIKYLDNENIAKCIDDMRIMGIELTTEELDKIEKGDEELIEMIKQIETSDKSILLMYKSIKRLKYIYGDEFIKIFLNIYENKEIPEDENLIMEEVRKYAKYIIGDFYETSKNDESSITFKKLTVEQYSKFARMITRDQLNIRGEENIIDDGKFLMLCDTCFIYDNTESYVKNMYRLIFDDYDEGLKYQYSKTYNVDMKDVNNDIYIYKFLVQSDNSFISNEKYEVYVTNENYELYEESDQLIEVEIMNFEKFKRQKIQKIKDNMSNSFYNKL